MRQQPVERPSDFLNAISVAHAGVFSGFTSARPLRDSNLHPPNPKIDAPASGRRSGTPVAVRFSSLNLLPVRSGSLGPIPMAGSPQAPGEARRAVRQQAVDRLSDFLNAISVAHLGVFSGTASPRPCRNSNLRLPNPAAQGSSIGFSCFGGRPPGRAMLAATVKFS